MRYKTVKIESELKMTKCWSWKLYVMWWKWSRKTCKKRSLFKISFIPDWFLFCSQKLSTSWSQAQGIPRVHFEWRHAILTALYIRYVKEWGARNELSARLLRSLHSSTYLVCKGVTSFEMRYSLRLGSVHFYNLKSTESHVQHFCSK